MRPLDPRLRHIRPARSYLLLTVGLGMASAGLVVAQALLIAALLAPAISSPGTMPPGAGSLFVGLCGVVVGRAVVAWAQERYALRAASRTIADLREQVVTAVATGSPRSPHSSTGVATLVTRGLDDLEPYLVRYVPQLVLTALLTPTLVVVVLGLDWISAVIVAVTLPLVPIFMVLVGRLTAGASERRLATVARLGDQVLDLVAGLPTLRAFGRAVGPAGRVRALGDASRRATMGTLRVAFLSSMVLELLTTLSVAIVAVGVGLRLVEGQMDLQPAIAVLVLAPEVYLPLRRVGAEFHASVDGVAAAGGALDVLASAPASPTAGPAPTARVGQVGTTLVFDDVAVRAPGRDVLAPDGLSARIPLGAGRIVALRGPSGSGKSTAVLVALGLLAPDGGRVYLDGSVPDSDISRGPHDSSADGTTPVGLSDVDPETWWRHVTWVPQRPSLPPGTLREILRPLGRQRGHDATDTTTAVLDPAVVQAARLSGLDRVVADLPDGWDTRVGLGGTGLSVGQRQRVALTTALLDDGAARPLVILDEPTAHLDARSEQEILDTVRTWRDAGRTVLVVAHRTALLEIADQVIDVRSRRTTTPEDSQEVAP